MDDHREDEHEQGGPDSATGAVGAPAVRGTGGARLQEAARALLAGATLDDLTAFVTVRRLAETSGLSSGAVYASFEPECGSGTRARTAPQAAARAAFRSLNVDADAASLRARSILLDQLADLPVDDPARWMEQIADVMAAAIAANARGEADDGWTFTHEWLGVAVSLNDPEVAAYLRAHLEGYDRAYAAALGELLALTGRELVDGIDLQAFARLFVAAGDGCALRLRLDPDLEPGMLSRVFLSLVDSMTRRVGTRDDLPGHRLTVEGQAPFDDLELEAVRAAVLRVHSRAGWPAVTLAKVSQLSGVPDGRLAGQFPSRHDLAAIVWRDLVSGLERRHLARSGLEPPMWLAAFLSDLCDTACSQRSLASSLLISRISATSDVDGPRSDPGSEHLVEVFASTISGVVDADADAVVHADAVEPVAAGDGFRVMARATLDLILLRASLSTMSGPELTSLIIDGMAGSGVTAAPSG